LSIKDILVYLDDGVANSDRVNTAFELAKTHEAKLSGASLASMKPVHAKSDDDQVIMRIADKQAHKLTEDFKEVASNAGHEASSIVISGGATTSAVKMAHYARNADLVILGQPDPSRDNYLRLQEFAQEIMLLSGRPILFIPYIGIRKKDYNYNKAMIAWDGTPAASRAVHDAIPLLARTEEVIILVVESKKQRELKKDLLVEGLVRHLANHDVKSHFLSVNPKKSDVASVILNQITDNNIDLLVIGGYGTPTLKQKIFGSVSATLLSSMIVPVIMSH
jgi:nucleotide-binding universal stress UspA family protein